jgi:four helix bundle protein
MRRGDDIAARLVDLAARVIKLTGSLPRDSTGRHVSSQLVRSATSSGANYEEARGAESLRDFVHKLRLADKEMREGIRPGG